MVFSQMTNTVSNDARPARQMIVVDNPVEMQEYAEKWVSEGKRIAFVPTMGYLHDGHLSLLREGRRRCELLVLSIFVNPIQFGEGEDFSVYPRDFKGDMELARGEGVDVIFTPHVEDLYPPNFSTYVEVGGLTDMLCGEKRPGHFRGVTTVLSKLFNLVRPSVAVFGKKDFQQLAVVRRMILDLNMNIELIGIPTAREADGLAISSRNVYLNDSQRVQALSLVEAIRLACGLVDKGERDTARIIAEVQKRIERELEASIDYVRICHEESLMDMETVTSHSVLLLAVRIGKTRLIDNHHLFTEGV